MDKHLNSPAAAWAALVDAIEPLPSVDLPLAEALGRRLAAPLTADRDIPPASRSAMDGFAVRAADLPGRLTVVGEVAAGSADRPEVARGTCVRLFTGANLPPGADAVVPVEATSSGDFTARPDDAEIEVLTAVAQGDHVFHQGENARAGEVLLPAGTRLGPRQIAVAASVGRDTVTVHRAPAVRILNTGRELLDVADIAAAHQTRDSNGPLLEAAFRAEGCADVARRLVPDDPVATREALAAALAEADLVVLTGGISAGRYDFVPEAVEAVGGEIVFRRVAIKPGKPQLFARMSDGRCIFGLPGNPLSVVVGLYEYALPASRRLAGCPLEDCRPERTLPLAEPFSHTLDVQRVLPAVLREVDGRTVAVPRPPVGSADLVTGGRVHGAILLDPRAGDLPAGHPVRFRPWSAPEA